MGTASRGGDGATAGKLERVPATETDAKGAVQKPHTSGLGYALITIYLILALAATLRAVYQIVAKFDEAPLAYSLSLVSGVVYIVATISLVRRTGVWRTVGISALLFELAGVLIVGTLSLTHPELFDHPSVWSWYGAGYGWVPLVLPILGLIWLLRSDTSGRADESAANGEDFGGSVY